jgi:acyl-CoA synthetase (AMP-forming)/AMP-acid ligase II
VFGVPDEKWGEAIRAAVVVKPDMSATEEEINVFCKNLLAAYKRPKTIEVIDKMPLTPYGKIDKKALRARYWQGEERAIH